MIYNLCLYKSVLVNDSNLSKLYLAERHDPCKLGDGRVEWLIVIISHACFILR